MGPYGSQVSQITSPGITGPDSGGSCAQYDAGTVLPRPFMAHACLRGPLTVKKEIDEINNLN